MSTISLEKKFTDEASWQWTTTPKAVRRGLLFAKSLESVSLVPSSTITNQDIYTIGRNFYFGDPRTSATWPSLVAQSRDFARLKCRVVAERSSFTGLLHSNLSDRIEISDACVRLISWRALKSRDLRRAELNMKAIFGLIGKSLRRHVDDLDGLRRMHPTISAATMEGRIKNAFTAARSLSGRGRSDETIKIIARHWILIAALDVQRGAAYIVSCRRWIIPLPLVSIIGAADVTANGLMFVAKAVAASSVVYIRSYLKPDRAENEDVRGAQSGPVRYLRNVLRIWEHRVDPQRAAVLETWLDGNLPLFRHRTAQVLEMMRSRLQEAWEAQLKLYRAAGHPISPGRLTLFAMWHDGMTPAAALILITQRYLEVASIAQAIIGDPRLAGQRNLTGQTKVPSVTAVKSLAHQVGLELMGAWSPNQTNTDAAFDLAKAYRNSTSASTPRSLDLLAMFDPRWAADVRL